jgi:hypothetical protein
MKLTWIATLPVAAALLIFPSISRAQSSVISSEAPGVVVLNNKVDAHKLAAGATVEMRLINTVHLSNGTELSKGTKLTATVAQDDKQVNGRSKLVLRFSSARTKNGKTIPIKATILAVSTDMAPVEDDPSDIEAVMEVPSNLKGEPDQIVQAVNSSLNLHSDATSQNSGVLSTDKDDIKLPYGTKMELALAPGQ